MLSFSPSFISTPFFLVSGTEHECTFHCPFKAHCVTLPMPAWLIGPRCFAKHKAYGKANGRRIKAPRVREGGCGIPCLILPRMLPNTANTHMFDRSEEKPPSCCFYCSVNRIANNFISLNPMWNLGRNVIGGRRPEPWRMSCIALESS